MDAFRIRSKVVLHFATMVYRILERPATNWNKAVIEIEREKIDIISLTNEVNELSRKNRNALDSFDELVRSMMTDEQLKQIK